MLNRRTFLTGAAAIAGAAGQLTCRNTRPLHAAETERPAIEAIRAKTLEYVESLRISGEPYGRWRYSAEVTEPTLYSSTYAAMTRDLYRDLGRLTANERQQWIDYLQSHQDDDGLFRDPAIFDQGWYKDDPEWCGRRHLSCHVITALAGLGATAAKPLCFLDSFLELGALEKWLEQRDWTHRPSFASNEVLNVGTLLQYARDNQKNARCAAAVRTMLDWMTHHHISPTTGLWGGLNAGDPQQLSRLVQAGYHFWLLYFYDRRSIPYPDRVVDSCLRTQNERGGFGQGVHNGANPLNSSACEDIDSIDPLARLMTARPYRRDEVRQALERALAWVLTNQNPDGGFVFMRRQPFVYGHPLLAAGKDRSGLFPTWFRTLSLAYLGKAMPDSIVGRFDWLFCDCPGLQFWRVPAAFFQIPTQNIDNTN